MFYPQVIRYLESFINYEKIPAYPYKESLKLEHIRGFLTAIGNPQATLKCIHIAGTKGKGSTCAFIAYILREAGYKVGLYTSPHLSDFRERIRILQPTTDNRQPTTDFEGMISKNELASLVERLRPAIDRYNKSSKYGPLSFFEVYTALAFVYFKEKKVDFAVLETGLGGRLDATNMVEPLVCAITPISYEHTDKLGNTLKEIATEKAGIIKGHQVTRSPGHQSVVISAPQEEEVREVIKDKCRKTGARLYEVGRQIKIRNFKIRLLGRHQLINANVAAVVIEALRSYNIKVSNSVIRKGLHNTVWPGRCEVVSKNPLVVLDGAQNVASAKALKKAIKENFSAEGARLPDGQGSASGGKYKRLILLLGISNDKDIKGVCAELSGLADEIILTKANNPRATEPVKLAGYFDSKPAYITKNVKEAKAKALNTAKREDLVLVTGSLFVVGEARELFYGFASAC